MNYIRIGLMLLITITHGLAQTKTLDIQLKNNDTREQQTKDQLLRLMDMYNLDRWIFSQRINIESGPSVIPHSHPVLTLSTRHLRDDDLLLATFIHEQLHWFFTAHAQKENVYQALQALYPEPRKDFPEGSGDAIGTLYHILICHLEYRALKQLLGELRAYQVMAFWKQDHYTWVYSRVIEDQDQLNELVKKYGITP